MTGRLSQVSIYTFFASFNYSITVPVMHISTSSSCLFTLTALTGLSTAATIPSTKQAFSVEQVATGESVTPEHPAQVLLSTYKKFNAVEQAPQDVVMAANTAGNVKFTSSATAYPASVYDEVSLYSIMPFELQLTI